MPLVSRPKACAVAIMFAFRLSTATVQDVRSVNATIQHLRSTAAMPVTIWRMDLMSVKFASMSAEEEDGSQVAWLVVTVDGIFTSQTTVHVSPMSWRSATLKRKASSTLAGGTLALSQAVAEVAQMGLSFLGLSRFWRGRKTWNLRNGKIA